ncbi:MAG: hypothetical protein Q4C95_04945 [Planctomycetia bacterium]|nr:hypothetical protein [Planctomycetia bacterium]
MTSFSRFTMLIVVLFWGMSGMPLSIEPVFDSSFCFSNEQESFDERLWIDWLQQDFGLDITQCFNSSQDASLEIALVQKCIDEIAEYDSEIAQSFQNELDQLINKQLTGRDPQWKNLYEKACRQRRQFRLEIVSEIYPKIIYTKHYLLGGSHYAYTEDTTDSTFLENSSQNERSPGASLWMLTVDEKGNISNELLLETQEGTLRDPDVSFDGQRILFSMRNNFDKDEFHLYELNSQTKELRQLTFGLGFADIEPAYLPNGDIIFASSRCMQVIDCWMTEASNFYTCDPDGRFLRRLCFDQVTTNYPKILNDGRVIYTRWEYQDRGQIFVQSLFSMNADGSGQTEFYGNNSWFPTTILHARAIPGSNKVIAIASGHHTKQKGKLILIDRDKGTQENSGVQLISPIRETQAERIDAYGQEGEQFQYPLALDEQNFIVTYMPEQYGTRPFGLYYMDINGRRELLAWDATTHCCQPVPLAARDIPVIRPSVVDYEKKTGLFYVQNVYEGPGLKGVPKGTIKWLRVIEPKFDRPVCIRSNTNNGPAGGAMVATPVSINNGSWDAKNVLGKVPVQEDGSAYFEVPALKPLYFQLLNENNEAVQTMRSWSTLQPGEFFACIGCHESKESVPINESVEMSKRTIALSEKPSQLIPSITPEKGAAQDYSFSFIRDIQPILDVHCISCHSGQIQSDGSQAPFSLLGNLYRRENGKWETNMSGRQFSEAYVNLTQNGQQNEWVNWINVQSVPPMLLPYDSGAVKSKMIQILREKDENHQSVALSEEELEKLIIWIDLAVPFCGDNQEAADWNPSEQAIFDYYKMKRDQMIALVEKNIEQLIAVQKGADLPEVNEIIHFNAGGSEAKQNFIDSRLKRTFPVLNRKSGSENVYRNLALNSDDIQLDIKAYPHAETNSEFGYLDSCSAKNAIDGKIDQNAWKPNYRTDVWLQIHFGHPVEVDKLVLAKLPKTAWKSATIEFSDGSRENISFNKEDLMQTFEFPKHQTNWIIITNLQQDFPLQPCGLTEVEVWGTSL